MGKKIDLTGQRFGRLVVVSESAERRSSKVMWECKCDCGNVKNVRGKSLRSGNTKSCGCLSKEKSKDNDTTAANKLTKKKFYKEGTAIHLIEQGLSKANKSGYKGVSWDKRSMKWRAQVMLKRKNYHLGLFDNKQDAINARKEAEEKYFKPILEKYSAIEEEANG